MDLVAHGVTETAQRALQGGDAVGGHVALHDQAVLAACGHGADVVDGHAVFQGVTHGKQRGAVRLRQAVALGVQFTLAGLTLPGHRVQLGGGVGDRQLVEPPRQAQFAQAGAGERGARGVPVGAQGGNDAHAVVAHDFRGDGVPVTQGFAQGAVQFRDVVGRGEQERHQGHPATAAQAADHAGQGAHGPAVGAVHVQVGLQFLALPGQSRDGFGRAFHHSRPLLLGGQGGGSGAVSAEFGDGAFRTGEQALILAAVLGVLPGEAPGVQGAFREGLEVQHADVLQRRDDRFAVPLAGGDHDLLHLVDHGSTALRMCSAAC